MKIIISPAKKMNVREDELDIAGLPCFLSRAEELKNYIQGLSFQEAKALWACNEKIARLNYERFADMDLKRRQTPALLAYEGIQYQYMAPGVFEKKQWDYVEEHLRILSGFYGILKPLDGVVPYRLEMQAKVRLSENKNSLYQFWGQSLAEELLKGEDENPLIVNLASKEYSKAVEPYLDGRTRFLTCVFGSIAKDSHGNRVIKVKATEAKMARGEMVRYLSEHQARSPEVLKDFQSLGYRYSQADSDSLEYVFIKEQEQTI